ncbi:Polyamine aminopropyltransferase [Polaromonas vacuolata]|uniref:Polyamine aminopropyltransferase n=1 Tax=Polaromonas vacuolata TaxID=37448 RepID=A0A6H2H657_9BURK|nr:spermidine synthase [Polaromonas vacuolata]QJC55338.1 Polyamine aminopropyltransferase [Polaromonas vacuolata]
MAKKEIPALIPELPEVNFSDYAGVRYLHLGSPWVQGSMLIDEPFEIELEYVQRMMAGLLFMNPADVAKKHAMQLGLGSAALTKFCYKKLRMKTTAIEINPQVIAACRGWFKLPRDDLRLAVINADAATEITQPCHLQSVDLLHVDVYDDEAAGPVLDSEAFYQSCYDLLAEDGVMTVNLFGRDSSYEQSLEYIAQAFGPQGVWAFRPTKEGNTVVLAQREPTRPERAELLLKAGEIESRWGLPAKKWLRLFKPLA